jgi:hypothetical protein
VLAHWNNSSWIDMLPHSDTLSWFPANQPLFFLLNAACLVLWLLNTGDCLIEVTAWEDLTVFKNKWSIIFQTYDKKKCIGGVIVSVLASSAVDCGFESWSGQTNDYKIGICCFSTKHADCCLTPTCRIYKTAKKGKKSNTCLFHLLLSWLSDWVSDYEGKYFLCFFFH